MKTTIVVPCYDEAEGVPKLIGVLSAVAAGLAAEGPVELIFVDDGSRDDTARRLEEHGDWPVPVRVLRHGRNLGLGAAVRTGFASADGDRIVVTDADGTYDFATIPALLRLLGDGVDLVVSSPYHPRGSVEGVPRYRLVLSQGASVLYRLVVDHRIHTYTSMYRAYRGDVARTTPFDADGFVAMTEILVNALRAGRRVVEYPAVLRVRQYGQSKARVLGIARTHFALLWRLLRTPRGRAVSSRLPGR